MVAVALNRTGPAFPGRMAKSYQTTERRFYAAGAISKVFPSYLRSLAEAEDPSGAAN